MLSKTLRDYSGVNGLDIYSWDAFPESRWISSYPYWNFSCFSLPL